MRVNESRLCDHLEQRHRYKCSEGSNCHERILVAHILRDRHQYPDGKDVTSDGSHDTIGAGLAEGHSVDVVSHQWVTLDELKAHAHEDENSLEPEETW